MPEPEPPPATAGQTATGPADYLARLTDGLALLSRRQDDLEERLSRLAVTLETVKQQTDWLVRHAAQLTQQLQRQCDELRQETHRLERERDDLNRRLQEALKQVALKGREGSYAGSGPTHDRLIQTFQRLKQQEFERLAQVAHAEALRQQSAALPPDRRRALAEIKGLLSQCLLVSAAEVLAAEPNPPPALDVRLAEGTAALLGQRLSVRLSVDATWQGVVREGLKLLRDMAAATPPGLLLLSPPGEAFDPQRHEAVRGCPEDGEVCVAFTVFPGYRIDSPPRVLHKAEVVTALAKA